MSERFDDFEAALDQIHRLRAENARLRDTLALVDKWSLVITSCAFRSSGVDAQSVVDVVLAVRAALKGTDNDPR
jgi:hypothetical protein